MKYKKGDLLAEDAEALVNTVNCVGAMGRGISLQFKRAFPDNFKAYEKACKNKEVLPGRMFVFETERLHPRFIINFPTKRHWRAESRMEDIESGLQALAEEIRVRGIRSIAIPALGSGLGGLNWPDVRSRIEKALRDFSDLSVVIFEPSPPPATERMVRNKKTPRMTPGRATLISLMRRFLRNVLDPFVTLLELHKLMYFMQVAGEPLRLKFTKGTYGPYAENLRHVLNALEGHLISGYADGGDAPGKPLELVPGAVEEADSFLEGEVKTRKRIERVADLVDGFESSAGLELLASVHWVAQNEDVHTVEDFIRHIHLWNPRKRKFSEGQIRLAHDVLSRKGWIDQPVTD